MSLQFWPSVVAMMMIATMTVFLVTSSGRSAWFVGVLVLVIYLTFAATLYLLCQRDHRATNALVTAESAPLRPSRPAFR